MTSELDIEEVFQGFHHRESGITMEDFISTYDYTIYDRDEIQALTWFPWPADPFADPPRLRVTRDDFLFVANIKERMSEILHDDLLTFMVSMRWGEWRILAWSS